MRKTITVLLLIVAVLLPFVVFDVLPVIGDPESAPNTHVSDYYIEHAIDECNSPNMVTAVIVDYRAFDTMFETTVMFLAGLSVVIILSVRPKRRIPQASSHKNPLLSFLLRPDRRGFSPYTASHILLCPKPLCYTSASRHLPP